jgi:GR25 family glycosyltransferase involved in LPS biosynthesis
MTRIQYYLIHGGDPIRKQKMDMEFDRWSFEPSKINWILHPNKNELSDEFIKRLVVQKPSLSNGSITPILNRKGAIACSYKHYLCLKDIVENKHDYGVIIEDNIFFTRDFPSFVPTYINQLNYIYGEWDILFNHFNESWGKYDYQPVKENLFVYPKSNEINKRCHGGSKSANCYLLTYSCAKKLYENFLPFNNAPCAHYNTLFRKLNIKSFWIEPSYAHFEHHHISTTTD